MAMKNTIRCCISCILPCGALDVIRIVHTNGRVEEISGTILASEIMKAYPKHVLKKPCSSPSEDGVVPKIVIVPPDAELQRGKIYFLMPLPPTSVPHEKKSKTTTTTTTKTTKTRETSVDTTTHHRSSHNRRKRSNSNVSNANSNSMTANLLVSDRYLSEILSEKVSTQRDRRRGRVGIWRPHLESICEASNDN
ncbi:uncharacterized protein LOC126673868 [Mercurialis annua]|uniref:uncharacterized protein LOC126673868 n=1 Tax=Mercurialis annua TaxID=3986 RepID=UPI00215E04FD|nr:uncharacterized protein LOC126673868 [Mercurialis annua]